MENNYNQMLTELNALLKEQGIEAVVEGVSESIIAFSYTPSDNPNFKGMTSATYDPRIVRGAYVVTILLPSVLKRKAPNSFVTLELSQETGEQLIALRYNKVPAAKPVSE